MEDQKCRICGCTENNCEQCIRQTGHPCHWVEPDLCSACHDSINQHKNKENMNFFRQLAEAGNVDMTMRIMQKNDKLTLNIMPGSSNSTTMPMIISGTGAELDEAFFANIKPAVDEVAGIRHNIQEAKDAAKKKEADAKKPAAKPAPKSKPVAKKAAPKKPEAPKPQSDDLFEMSDTAEDEVVTDQESEYDDSDQQNEE